MSKSVNPLAAYRYQPMDKIKITASPKVPFRIHPNPDRKEEDLLVTNYHNKWYLVNEGLLEGFHIPGLLRACFYEGIDEDHQRFLLISTYPLGQEMTEWRESVLEVVEEAQNQWVWMVRNKKGDGYRVKVADHIDTFPLWVKDDFSSFVARAFGKNVINTECDFSAMFPEDSERSGKGGRSRMIDEEFDG